MEIFERYNFKYEIVKNIINYDLPFNDKIIKNIELFYSLIKDYKNNILFKNYFYQGSNSANLKYTYILNKYGAQKKDNMLIISDHVIKDDKKINKKYDLINKLELLYDEDKTKFEFKSVIHTIGHIFKNLNNKGYYFFNIIKFDSNMIKFVNLLLLLFNHIYYYSDYILCFEFNPIINEEKFKDLLKNIENVEITPLINLEKISKQQLDISKLNLEIITSIKDNNIDKYFDITNKLYFNEMIEQQIHSHNKNINEKFEKELLDHLKLMVNSFESNKLESPIKYEEGITIYDTIIKNNFSKCLEIGMGYGISSIYILLALQKNPNNEKKLVSIDLLQSTQWKNFGIKILKFFNMIKYHKLIENIHYIELPKIVANKENYEFIFINSWYSFENMIIILFYCSKILQKDGIIIINEIYQPGIYKCIKYIDNNYKHFKRINSPPNIAVYQKIKEDNRSWDYHNNF
jgi:predicted O-methyltransferase YrrM